MLYFALLAVLFISFSRAQEIETNPSGDKSQCIKRMVDWCNGMEYAQNSTSMSVLSISYGDMSTSTNYRVLCFVDSGGTNCSRNGSPWLSCTPDHTLSYNGQVMTESSTDVDDDICNTTRKALDELSLQTMTNSNSLNWNTQQYLQELHEEMAELMRMFRNFQMELGPLFGGGGSDDGDAMFPELNFGGGSDSGETSTEESNQIERE